MGLRTRGEIAERLVQRGWPSETPAAIVLGASHANEARWIGTLATIGAAEIHSDAPGVLVIGKVVELAHAQRDVLRVARSS